MSDGDRSDELYAGREQTLVKHLILEKYLERFAHIVGTHWSTITYVDCFSGPWNAQSEHLDDASFSIALKQLRKAKSHLAASGKRLNLRCFFLERDPDAYQRLDEFANQAEDADVKTLNQPLEKAVDAILEFIYRRRDNSFPFVFVDPTGWTGFGMDVIAPLLRVRPGEILVNFMTGHILRFAEADDVGIRRSFDALFRPIDYRTRLEGLAGQDREDELVRCYVDAIKANGSFDYVCSAVVLHPLKKRTHYHLIYATRHRKGVEVFKQAEKSAMQMMEDAREAAMKAKRFKQDHQLELEFSGKVSQGSEYFEQLRERYLVDGRKFAWNRLSRKRAMRFELLWAESCQLPLIWYGDVKDWVTDWKRQKRIQIVPGEGETQRLKRYGQQVIKLI